MANPSSSSTCSSPWGAINCIPTGKHSETPIGIDMAGMPTRFASWQNLIRVSVNFRSDMPNLKAPSGMRGAVHGTVGVIITWHCINASETVVCSFLRTFWADTYMLAENPAMLYKLICVSRLSCFLNDGLYQYSACKMKKSAFDFEVAA